eukprot:14709723-Alexandrium_andersonii.AAC.1
MVPFAQDNALCPPSGRPGRKQSDNQARNHAVEQASNLRVIQPGSSNSKPERPTSFKTLRRAARATLAFDGAGTGDFYALTEN